MFLQVTGALANHLRKLWKSAETNYTILAIDFVSRYSVSRENSANIRPNLKCGGGGVARVRARVSFMIMHISSSRYSLT